MKTIIAFIVGLLFALGLGFSGMTQIQTVKGFLDILGSWNPALMGVMIGAIGIHSILFHLIKKRGTPLLDTKFHLPTRNDIDKKLLIGAALFGIGWGWGGICPGPGIVAATSGEFKHDCIRCLNARRDADS
ncbi:MAG: YeeE/YedE family protein [Bacteriovoracaceae bacterium]|nr:YeeE/YedE family protein [Bacteriovoracaceae bacterium]